MSRWTIHTKERGQISCIMRNLDLKKLFLSHNAETGSGAGEMLCSALILHSKAVHNGVKLTFNGHSFACYPHGLQSKIINNHCK